MENVTLNRKEQARLRILNSLLADFMTVDQAATLMGADYWRHLEGEHGISRSIAVRHVRE